MKTINDLAKEVVRREGKKESISIAQVKEVLGIVADIFFEEGNAVVETYWVMYSNGRNRFNKKIKKAKK